MTNLTDYLTIKNLKIKLNSFIFKNDCNKSMLLSFSQLIDEIDKLGIPLESKHSNFLWFEKGFIILSDDFFNQNSKQKLFYTNRNKNKLDNKKIERLIRDINLLNNISISNIEIEEVAEVIYENN